MYHKSRFFIEYAALQRVSHNRRMAISIRDFSYLKRCPYLVFFFSFFFKKPWEYHTGKAFKAVYAYIINSAISALSRSIKFTHAFHSVQGLRATDFSDNELRVEESNIVGILSQHY